MNRIIARALRQWQIWRDRRAASSNYRRLVKQYPELSRIDQAQKEARRMHRPTKHFDEARKAAVMALLKGNG